MQVFIALNGSLDENNQARKFSDREHAFNCRAQHSRFFPMQVDCLSLGKYSFRFRSSWMNRSASRMINWESASQFRCGYSWELCFNTHRGVSKVDNKINEVFHSFIWHRDRFAMACSWPTHLPESDYKSDAMQALRTRISVVLTWKKRSMRRRALDGPLAIDFSTVRRGPSTAHALRPQRLRRYAN